MYKNKKIAAVIPAYNEEKLISRVITTMPDFVDKMYIVDDASKDSTIEIVNFFADQSPDRICLIHHEKNLGVGGAILSGHQKALSDGMDIMVVLAGDAQMDPNDLPTVIDPIADDVADYAKGNRFISGEAWLNMPRVRFYANAGLSFLNKFASGYWHISDPQCGYTAISSQIFKKMDMNRISRGYHFENSMLIDLNMINARVVDVPIKAVYGIGEKSGINHVFAVISFSAFLFKAFWWRLFQKYVIRDFHPLFFFYIFGILFFFSGAIFGLYIAGIRLTGHLITSTSALFAVFLFTTGLQMLLFAMWFDRDYLRRQ
ncbi:MAG: glycosyltransferase family 2 protein [Chloroflexi bacterium HGW-Chloroflexi-8]|nr:MAG: glycosyltransferase family 2 protein [Chloroflexi bacterium HGW-Chloroflexi-8]